MSLDSSIEAATYEVRDSPYQVALLNHLRGQTTPLQERGLIDPGNRLEIAYALVLAAKVNERAGGALDDKVKIESLRWWRRPETPEVWQRLVTTVSARERAILIGTIGQLYWSRKDFMSFPTILERQNSIWVSVPNPQYRQELQDRKGVAFLREGGLEGILRLDRMGSARAATLYTCFARFEAA